MSRPKIRVAAVTAVVLLAVVAVYPSISLLRMDAQEPAKPEGTASKLKELQKERLAATRDFAKQVRERVKNGNGTLEELIEPTRMVLEAELAVCDSDMERIAVLEKILAEAKDTERLTDGFAKRGAGRQSTALMAKAERLRIEIALERMKARKDAPQQGAAIEPESPAPVKVKDIQPKKGDRQKVSVQVGSVEAFESVRVFAQVPGVLKTQSFDIGDRVKRGQVLAVLHTPDLEMQIEHDTAAVDQARARVAQAKTGVNVARANLESAMGTVRQAEANVKGAAAVVQYRDKQFNRMKELLATKSIEERLLDEVKDHFNAAVETGHAAKAAIVTAKAQLVAGEAKVEQAQADVATVEADVKLAQTKLRKSQEQLSLATLHAPFDGVITQRGYFPGVFIRSANTEPLLTVQRTDIVRVVVMMPERDVPFVKLGAAADVELEALAGKKWSAKVSRTAVVLDAKTRTMRVELDLANPTGQFRPGMSAKVSIVLEK